MTIMVYVMTKHKIAHKKHKVTHKKHSHTQNTGYWKHLLLLLLLSVGCILLHIHLVGVNLYQRSGRQGSMVGFGFVFVFVCTGEYGRCWVLLVWVWVKPQITKTHTHSHSHSHTHKNTHTHTHTGLQYNCPKGHYNDLATLYFSQPSETIRTVCMGCVQQ